MTSAFDELRRQLRQLPGLGHRSAERIALHLLVEKPERAPELVTALQAAAAAVRRCLRCGNMAEAELCPICADERRDQGVLCVVEHVPDLVAMERAGSYRGVYHVLHGRLSPIHGVGPEQLNLASLMRRAAEPTTSELILALANDVEGEATCHYITQHLGGEHVPKVSRIGFGLPSGGGVLYADSVTLKSALDARRQY